MSGRVFVDETKRHGYLLVAVALAGADVEHMRKTLRALVLSGQRRLHMNDESDPRRRTIAAAIVEGPLTATVYDAARRHRNERERRAACLRAVVTDAATRGDGLVVIEQDQTLIRSDDQLLIEATRAAGCRETLRWQHTTAAGEPLLAIPDAIAWCWAKGGDWRRRVEPVVALVREV